MSGEKITQEEMVAMFGAEMPIEAVELLWNAPDSKTIGEIRTDLRKIAEQNKNGKCGSDCGSPESEGS